MRAIGIIGLGSAGMRHARNLRALGCNVRGYDTDMSKRLALNGVLWEMNEVMQSDAVVIASPTPDHDEHLLDALSEVGKCFVEKPISDQRYRAFNIRPELMRNDVMMGNNCRYHPCVKQAKEWLPQIGSIVTALFECAQLNTKPAYLRDGVILNWGAHEVDLALYLLGPASVTASWARLTDGKDDVAEIRLQHKDGATSDVRLDYITSPQRRSFVITGTRGSIRCDLERFTAALDTEKDSTLEFLSGTWDQTYLEEMHEFLRRVDGEEPDGIGATGEDGLACLEILLEARKRAGL